MMNYNSITVKQYQEVEAARCHIKDPIEFIATCVCILFNLTYSEVDNMCPNKFLRLSNQVKTLFSKEPGGVARRRLKWFKIHYKAETLKWRQYVEIQYWIKRDISFSFHLIVASCAAPLWGKNKPENFIKVSEALKNFSYPLVYFSAMQILDNVSNLNKRFNAQPIDEETEAEETTEPNVPVQDYSSDFIEKWGWIYSTNRIAEHRRITLDEAYELTAIQALNDLQFIKDLQDYEKRLSNATSFSA